MKKLFIVANWKANKDSSEATSWLKEVSIIKSELGEREVIVCPPLTLLALLQEQVKKQKLPLILGGQDISPFPKGAYTGEIAGEQLAEYAKYVIIGHSERRKYFHEDSQMLANKVDMALENKLIPIFCVQGSEVEIPKGVTIVAYEPVFAIGTGDPDTPENAQKVAEKTKEMSRVKHVIYGGSVIDKNVHAFTSMSALDGVLVGSASLDPVIFSHIIKNA